MVYLEMKVWRDSNLTTRLWRTRHIKTTIKKINHSIEKNLPIFSVRCWQKNWTGESLALWRQACRPSQRTRRLHIYFEYTIWFDNDIFNAWCYNFSMISRFEELLTCTLCNVLSLSLKWRWINALKIFFNRFEHLSKCWTNDRPAHQICKWQRDQRERERERERGAALTSYVQIM